MLESFYIKNYRLFKELKINSLKRVNLIIGKNNVGKSSLLEAISIYCDKENLIQSIYSLLCDRGEWIEDDFNPQNILNSLKTLCYGRETVFSRKNAIYIGSSETTGIFFYIFNHVDKKTVPLLVVNDNNIKNEISLSDVKSYIDSPAIETHILVAANPLSECFERLALDWSKIALTEKENYVIESLKIIDKNIERLAFVDETAKKKKAIIKLGNIDNPVALGSMGDGIIRIFRIILSLVRCENRSLLIDEFENGLHWSVQTDLWKIIYHLANKLNIQIFATTHSRDTISALQHVVLSEGYEGDTRIIKLISSPKKQSAKAAEFDIEDVKSLLEQDLEIR